jgi:hypothetical protein
VCKKTGRALGPLPLNGRHHSSQRLRPLFRGLHRVLVLHARYGRDRVVLLHEEGVGIPSNLGGVAYVPFPKGGVA